MNYLLLSAIILILIWREKTVEKIWSLHNYDEIYKRNANIAGIPWEALKAIAQIESSENHLAINENEGRGRISVGLMQILYPHTLNALNRIYHLNFSKNDLFNPEINVELAAYLINDIRGQGYTNLSDTIASYNAGAPHVIDGKYVNQEYVDRFFRHYDKIVESDGI